MFDWKFKSAQVVKLNDDELDELARLAILRYENEDGDLITVVFEGFLNGWHFKGILDSLNIDEAEQVLVDAFNRMRKER